MRSLMSSRLMGLAAVMAMYPGLSVIGSPRSPLNAFERIGLTPMIGPAERKRHTPRSDRIATQGSREAQRRRRQSLDFSASERCINRIRTQMGVN